MIENIKMMENAVNQKFPQHSFNNDLGMDNSHTYCRWPQTFMPGGHNLS